MRTTTRNSSKRLRNRNARGLRDELLQHGTPEQLRRAIIGDPDMRTAFGSYGRLLDTLIDHPSQGRTFLRLVSDGCAPGVMLSLLGSCVLLDQIVSRFKKELDSLKSRFDGLIRRLESLSADVASLRTIRIGDASLATSFSFSEIDDRVGTHFAHKYMFAELPSSLIWAKAFLKELKQNLAEEHSVRRCTSAERYAWLYLYCCAGTGRRVTYHEIAELLNAGFIANDSARDISEAVVRMNLQRFKCSAAAFSYEHVELLMKDYVRSCPAGEPTLNDWLSSDLDDRVRSHVAPMEPGRVLSEKERRVLKLAEHKRQKK